LVHILFCRLPNEYKDPNPIFQYLIRKPFDFHINLHRNPQNAVVLKNLTCIVSNLEDVATQHNPDNMSHISVTDIHDGPAFTMNTLHSLPSAYSMPDPRMTTRHLNVPCVKQTVIRVRPYSSTRNRFRTISNSSSSNGNYKNGSEGVDVYFRPGQEGESRQQLFNSISSVYDDLNDRFSFGLHRVWKRMAVKWCKARPGDVVLDSCCGSGDIAQILSSVVGKQGKVVGLDFSRDMLVDAKSRDKRNSNIEWVQGDALELPYADGYFDAATMGYGLRNVSDIPRALRELHRVLRKGGCVAILDFNNSDNEVVDGIQEFFLESLVVPAAEAEGVGDQYKYLRPSIKKYPHGKALEKLASQSGFESARYYEIGLGLMGCLVCQK
jgi:ubiquinone/menaquinone biosynthesis methyltransferase